MIGCWLINGCGLARKGVARCSSEIQLEMSKDVQKQASVRHRRKSGILQERVKVGVRVSMDKRENVIGGKKEGKADGRREAAAEFGWEGLGVTLWMVSRLNRAVL